MKISKKVLVEYINSVISEARATPLEFDSEAKPIKTGQVKFDYGTYKGKLKDMSYYVDTERGSLGDIQRKGDPYTYVRAGSDKLRVVSGPAKDPSAAGRFLGATIADPDPKSAKAPAVAKAPETKDKPKAAAVPPPKPTRKGPVRYKATKEQIANLGLKLNDHPDLDRTQKGAYKTLANDVMIGKLNKDRALETFLKAPGLSRDEKRKVASEAGIELS